MKTPLTPTKLALEAHTNNVSRADFLKTISPEDRSEVAMQFDRIGALNQELANPPTEEAITNEARRIAFITRATYYIKRHPSPYRRSILEFMLADRLMSGGMKREAAKVSAYAYQITPDEMAVARPQALVSLNGNRDFLVARLGLAI